MSFRRILTVASRIIRQIARDRRTLALLFLVPLFVMTLLQFILNSSNSSATLAIVPPSGMTSIVDSLQQRAGDQKTLTIITLRADQVEGALKAGDIDGALIFPSDYLQQVQKGQSPTLSLRLEGSNPAVAQQLRGMATMLVASIPVPGAQQATPKSELAVSYLYGGPEYTQTDAQAPLFIGLFSFFFVFLLTSVSFLRERSQGTIERIMVSPLRRTELVLGYVCGFTLFALAQSAIILLYVIGVLRVHYAGNPFVLFLVTSLLTIGGVNLGIFISAFAHNELQIIQFIPIVLIPQVLLGGLFFSVKTLPVVLYQIAYVLPLTYANFALKDVMLKGFGVADILGDLGFIVAFALVMVLLSAFSLRQEKI